MTDSEPRLVELFVRSLTPPGARAAQNDIVDRMVALREADVVEEVDLTVWGNGVPLSGTCARVGVGSHVANAIRAFRRWCEERDASLEPFFTWSAVDSSITGESYDRVVPPHRCLAVWDDDGVAAVYPCRIGDETRSIEDGLRALERLRSAPSPLEGVGLSGGQ